ncbi:uncharacterized protein LOC129222332 [Uloborus diversus]|uniref:uncharacterized protein LOC129222332 n=1 Tax=Uloborus diversus TaxID=327109 RepID=UPI0024094927|nr:uncharacterized protein LOC129222332 [Uloborus diversus]
MDRWRTAFARTSSVIFHLLLFREALSVAVTEVRLASSDIRPYVLQGEPATLTCHYIVERSEEVTEVEWEKDGILVYLWTIDNPPEAKDVLEGKVDTSVQSPSTLVIKNAHMDMQGTYTCRVRTNGKTAQNDMFLMVIVDACDESSWKTHTDMINCIETVSMHCVGIFPKPSPACGVYSERTGRYLNSVPFDSVNLLFNKTYEVSVNRRFIIHDWVNHTDLSFRCYMMVMGTPWRSGIKHKMFGDPGCEKSPPEVKHGYYNLTQEKSCWGFPSEGSRAEYQCEDGYTLLGSPLYVCSDGKWTVEGVLVDEDYEIPVCSDGSGAGIISASLTVLLFCIYTSIRRTHLT